MANENKPISSSMGELTLYFENYGVEDTISLHPTKEGIYSFEIFGSSGQGSAPSALIPLFDAGVGSGGGGGCYGYFELKLGEYWESGLARNFITISFPESADAQRRDIVLEGLSVLDTESCNFKLTAFAGKNGNVKTGGYLSFTKSIENPDDNENKLFVFYHSSSGGAGEKTSNINWRDWENALQNISLGGSGGKDFSQEATIKGYSGGVGQVVVGGSVVRGAGDGQGGKIVIKYVKSLEDTESGGGGTSGDGDNTGGGTGDGDNTGNGGTTEPETPPSGTDPETPSQPSVTTSNILTKDKINNLKNKIGTEIQNRRKYCGELSNYKATSITGVEQNTPAVASQGKELIDPLLAINSNQNISINTNEPINNYYYINSKITELSNIALNSTSHGCSAACTGLCSTTCGNTCSGKCTTTCSDSCGTGSKGSVGTIGCGGCGNECTGNCSTSSDNNCGSCADDCTGCNAWCGSTCGAWCLAGLESSCTDCTGSCGSGCSGTCYGDCGHACSGSCTDACDDSCGSSCRGNCSTSSSSDSGGYACDDCTEECYTGCNTRCESGCKNSCGSDNCTGSCLFSCTSTCGNFCTGNNKL